jgi:hypothetical protein
VPIAGPSVEVLATGGPPKLPLTLLVCQGVLVIVQTWGHRQPHEGFTSILLELADLEWLEHQLAHARERLEGQSHG